MANYYLAEFDGNYNMTLWVFGRKSKRDAVSELSGATAIPADTARNALSKATLISIDKTSVKKLPKWVRPYISKRLKFDESSAVVSYLH